MKELHRKDLASHSGPESCDASRKVCDEALTGELRESGVVGDPLHVWKLQVSELGDPNLLRNKMEGRSALRRS
jgi:hypothetical protein